MKLIHLNKIETTKVSHNPNVTKQVLIGYGEIEHLTGFSRAVFPPGEIAYAHSHTNLTEIFFIESGEGTMTVDKETINLNPGMSIAVEPNEIHEINNTGDNDLTLLFFGIEKN